MKVLLDIKDSKARHLLEVLKGLSYVKTKTLSNEKAFESGMPGFVSGVSGLSGLSGR